MYNFLLWYMYFECFDKLIELLNNNIQWIEILSSISQYFFKLLSHADLEKKMNMNKKLCKMQDIVSHIRAISYLIFQAIDITMVFGKRCTNDDSYIPISACLSKCIHCSWILLKQQLHNCWSLGFFCWTRNLGNRMKQTLSTK